MVRRVLGGVKLKQVISDGLIFVAFIALGLLGIYYFEIQKGIPRLIWGGPLVCVFFTTLLGYLEYE